MKFSCRPSCVGILIKNDDTVYPWTVCHLLQCFKVQSNTPLQFFSLPNIIMIFVTNMVLITLCPKKLVIIRI